MLSCLARKRDRRVRSAAQVYRLLAAVVDPGAPVAPARAAPGGLPGWAIGLGVAVLLALVGWILFGR